ncbi:MAG: D-alanyl-D-alanine carboxypeptidase/D-alanyl-D-alanine-endopeptidase [Ignavibacteria bacterium RBG_16_34_14]|nr:MAG: D-alanyl-D-alanine carboxypeptidase/D-alanyl-D-alanine-endopeptidase [Ignavibacteria bacterium RBG_16_34_14]
MKIFKYLLFSLLLLVPLLGSSEEEIRNKIDLILSKLPPTTKVGILIYNPLTEDTIYSLNHTISMIPASNTKLFTTATALSLMGGDFILYTKILSDDNNLDDGVIDGNLYIKGYGNSLFTTGDLQKMVEELKDIGITKINGKIIGDDSYFDNIYTRDDWITDEVANVKLPPISALVIDNNKKIIQKKRRGRLRNYYVNIDNPPLNAAMLLRDKLQEAGIDVALNAEEGITPEEAKSISEKGVELRELIKSINKESDNFLAECLFKTIGAVSSGKQGNAFYSTQTILTYISDNGIFSQGTAIVDGSGISRFDHVTVGAITGLLEKMYFDIANFDDFYNSLSIAGVDGTLRRRMTGTFVENNFRGKTGTLNGVSSISGYLTSENGDDLIISIFFEFTRSGAKFHRNIQDDIIQTLCGWN